MHGKCSPNAGYCDSSAYRYIIDTNWTVIPPGMHLDHLTTEEELDLGSTKG